MNTSATHLAVSFSAKKNRTAGRAEKKQLNVF
jgi:hypothetical protein